MKNITLTLYAFHLKQSLGGFPETLPNQGEQLWTSLIQLGNVYPFPELQNLKSHLVSYTPDHNGNYIYHPEAEKQHSGGCLTPHNHAITLGQIQTTAGFKLTGDIEPYLLNDTYCLTLTLNPIDDWPFELGLADLKPFHAHCLIQDITASLGRVLVFYGEQDEQLGEPTRLDAEQWAIALCEQTGLQPEFRGEFVWFNSRGFWFEASGLTLWMLLPQPHQFEGEQFSENSLFFRDLLWSFVKVKAVYAEAKASHQQATLYYEKLEKQVAQFYTTLNQDAQNKLNTLAKMIQMVPQDLLYYHCCLRDLRTHHTTLKSNIHNFQVSLDYLLTVNGNEFKNWSELAQRTYPHYLQQLEFYLEYLEPGRELFSDLINTIRATTEIEQAKHEQELQHQIQAVGTGIAAGAIVASSSGLIVAQDEDYPMFGGVAWHPLGVALLASVVCAIGSWGLMLRYLRRKDEG
ncbi:DUF4267 domain-containing protein [Spirulina major]|uniref:DUF4267 domain-containing protein n=1 Tax=Spirulina major TaxID=270636 RepID=UPI00093382D5|nr:DUF4267 domain-containing protein [Spirulina major]